MGGRELAASIHGKRRQTRAETLSRLGHPELSTGWSGIQHCHKTTVCVIAFGGIVLKQRLSYNPRGEADPGWGGVRGESHQHRSWYEYTSDSGNATLNIMN